jgi:hypothetical protein
MRKGHVLVKEDSVWKPNTVGRPHAPVYYITERFTGSEGQEQRAVIASFSKAEDRDNIYDAMVHAGLCSHSKLPSWVRSIHIAEEGWKRIGKRRWKHSDRLRVIERVGELYKTLDPRGFIYCGASLTAAMEARRSPEEEQDLLAYQAEWKRKQEEQ